MSSMVIPFIGGLAMFIYGMNIMADGLQNAAGSKMKKILEVLTQNKLMGILLGALVTAIIQSSSATTVMVVGFVNAGLMNLTQAISVIMGANIGTTITGWLVSSAEWAKFLSPSTLAPLAVMAGVIITLVGKKAKSKDVAAIVIGFGILFIGMSTMSDAVKELREKLFYEKKNGLLKADDATLDSMQKYCEGYKAYLDDINSSTGACTLSNGDILTNLCTPFSFFK